MAQNAEFAAIIGYLERERGVDRESLLLAIESSVEQAARKSTRVSADFQVHIDRKTLEIKAWDVYAVSDTEHGLGILTVAQARRFDPNVNDGDTVTVPFPASKLGRIVAQTAKQTIQQRIREAERDRVYEEYRGREGDIVTGTVKMVARKDVYVDLGKTEAQMPARERIPSEDYNAGDVIRAYIKEVRKDSSGPAVVLSRACPDFVRALFHLEVSDVADGVVEVMGVARDPGRRSKVAVRSLDPAVDPVGACVGARGARVQNIVQELNGEKLDIVHYSDDPEVYVRNALRPAQPTTLELDFENHAVYATVPADKLSLAIGRSGQNVRLATRLTGWRISITADEVVVEDTEDDEATFNSKRDEMTYRLAKEFDVTTAVAEKLMTCGFHSPEGVLFVEPAYLQTQTGLEDAEVQHIYDVARSIVDAKGE